MLSHLDIINTLVTFSPRQGDNEILAYEYIRHIFDNEKVSYSDQVVETTIPVTKKAALSADGKTIACLGVGLKSGKWFGKENIMSSLLDYNDIYYIQNSLNFNPVCETAISAVTYFDGPALAFNKSALATLMAADSIEAELIVDPYSFKSHNLLIGNTDKPTNIVFTHYDSLGTGAIDNASGTAIVIKTILDNPKLLKNNLFVIAGNEELSYEMPYYWGKGYRNFENEFNSQIHQAHNVLVVDSIGHSQASWITDPNVTILAIPLANFKQYHKKISVLASDLKKLMSFYHSDADTPKEINDLFIQNAQQQLVSFLNKH